MRVSASLCAQCAVCCLLCVCAVVPTCSKASATSCLGAGVRTTVLVAKGKPLPAVVPLELHGHQLLLLLRGPARLYAVVLDGPMAEHHGRQGHLRGLDKLLDRGRQRKWRETIK